MSGKHDMIPHVLQNESHPFNQQWRQIESVCLVWSEAVRLAHRCATDSVARLASTSWHTPLLDTVRLAMPTPLSCLITPCQLRCLQGSQRGDCPSRPYLAADWEQARQINGSRESSILLACKGLGQSAGVCRWRCNGVCNVGSTLCPSAFMRTS